VALGPGSVGVALLAGVLSTLSPCVLPILPLVLAGAAAAHRFGVAALATGLMLSFTAIGLFVATIGFSIGLDAGVFRDFSAVLLALLGFFLISGAAQERLAIATSGLGDAGNRLLSRMSPAGLSGQFLIGVVLGAVWSPCVGPTLGAASLLAAQGRDLAAACGVMLAFGLGASLPLLLVGSLSREAMRRWRGRMAGAGRGGKLFLGAGALAVATLILTGADRAVETWAVAASPGWLTDLTTRF
jgi:cytochrome c-type biogenesis protein